VVDVDRLDLDELREFSPQKGKLTEYPTKEGVPSPDTYD
jgi:hypothetical protein